MACCSVCLERGESGCECRDEEDQLREDSQIFKELLATLERPADSQGHTWSIMFAWLMDR